jgi:hypothetical protein
MCLGRGSLEPDDGQGIGNDAQGLFQGLDLFLKPSNFRYDMSILTSLQSAVPLQAFGDALNLPAQLNDLGPEVSDFRPQGERRRSFGPNWSEGVFHTRLGLAGYLQPSTTAGLFKINTLRTTPRGVKNSRDLNPATIRRRIDVTLLNRGP